MGPPSDRPTSDPLLRLDSAPRDARGVPVRAPLGNSIRTFVVLTLLILIGVGVWWMSQPEDLVGRLGGREWVIVDVDGAAVTNPTGLVSAFVLDGSGEIRAPRDCNVATGSWTYDERRDRLEIGWVDSTELACPDDWPSTAPVAGGDVSIDGGVLRIVSGLRVVRAVSLADGVTMPFEALEGTWSSGERSIEIGRRGLFRVDECRGEWAPTDDGSAMTVRFDHLHADDCGLGVTWLEETPIVPVAVAGSVFLRRDRTIFPLDRAIVRLDAVS